MVKKKNEIFTINEEYDINDILTIVNSIVDKYDTGENKKTIIRKYNHHHLEKANRLMQLEINRFKKAVTQNK